MDATPAVTALAGLALGLLVALVLRRRTLQRHHDSRSTIAELAAAEREATLQAVQQVLHERDAEVGRTVGQAVDTLLAVAGDKLDGHLRQGTRELEHQGQSIDHRFGELRGELHRVTELVSALQRERAEQHGQLVNGLQEHARRSAELASTTQELRQALASPKARGQWGERMADDVLRLAGLREGVNYRKQTALAGGTVPDVTFFMPRGLLLNMDVKFPIDNYLRFLSADNEAAADQARTAFVRDVRNRVKEITTRDYVDPQTTVDCVLLFIPNEAVYSFVHEHDPELADFALRQKVVLCSPFTLFAVLGVVRQAMDNFLLERASDEILTCLTGMTHEWGRFTDQLDKVGRSIESVHKNYESLAGTRRRALEKRLDEVEAIRQRRGLPEPGDEIGEARLLREVSAG